VIVGLEEYAVTFSLSAVIGKVMLKNVAELTALASELTNQFASDDVNVDEPVL